MSEIDGTRTFRAPADAYDAFMGRYSRALAPSFADYGVPPEATSFLDVGCGPGALTGVVATRLGASAVSAVDPAAGFVAACQQRHPGVDVRRAPAEELPHDTGVFDAAAAQLVFHFVSDPERAAAEMRRVVRPGGTLSAAVWDFAEGMEMLRAFWDAALSVDPQAPDEARTLRFGGPGELTDLFGHAGLEDVEETTLAVSSDYADFDELWSSFLHGIGPAGAYAVSLPGPQRDRLREALAERMGHPTESFSLRAVARVVRGHAPGRA